MAMMEHECLNKECCKFWSNNQQEFFCPDCGSSQVRSTADESTD